MPVTGKEAFKIIWHDAPLHTIDALDRIEEALHDVKTLGEIKRVKRAFEATFWPTVALFFLAFFTILLLSVFFLLLEMGLAYMIAKWLDPLLQRQLSFETAFVLLFLLGHFALSPLLASLINGVYWSLFRKRMEILDRIVNDVDIAVAGIGRQPA